MNYLLGEKNVYRHMTVNDILKIGAKFSSFREIQELLDQCNNLKGCLANYKYELRITPTYL